ncbi:MAG: lasso peptide biosynthesis B2 protein [Gemmatimonadota bacterium]
MQLRQLLKRTRKAATLSPSQWSDLLRAQWYILRAHYRLRGTPEGELMTGWATRGTRSEKMEAGQVDLSRLDRARVVGEAVRRIGDFGLTRPRCLARSIAITEMMRSEGIEGADIHIGIRTVPGKLEAHAWVEFAGEVVGDTRAYVNRFAEMATTRSMQEQRDPSR